jgi:hypothetical protein
MRVKIVKYLNGDELLVAIHILDDDGQEVDTLQFYNNPAETSTEPMLQPSLKKLPDLLKFLAGTTEPVAFEEETVQV